MIYNQFVFCFLSVGLQFDGDFEDYATADDSLLTTEPLTDEDIIQTVTDKYNPDKEDEDDEDDEPETSSPTPSISAALDSCTTLRDFVQSQPDTQDLFKHINAIQQYITRKQFQTKQQTSIRDFFFR